MDLDHAISIHLHSRRLGIRRLANGSRHRCVEPDKVFLGEQYKVGGRHGDDGPMDCGVVKTVGIDGLIANTLQTAKTEIREDSLMALESSDSGLRNCGSSRTVSPPSERVTVHGFVIVQTRERLRTHGAPKSALEDLAFHIG